MVGMPRGVAGCSAASGGRVVPPPPPHTRCNTLKVVNSYIYIYMLCVVVSVRCVFIAVEMYSRSVRARSSQRRLARRRGLGTRSWQKKKWKKKKICPVILKTERTVVSRSRTLVRGRYMHCSHINHAHNWRERVRDRCYYYWSSGRVQTTKFGINIYNIGSPARPL